jgi:hypothetical protein
MVNRWLCIIHAEDPRVRELNPTGVAIVPPIISAAAFKF